MKQLNPQQELFWSYYTNPDSETFSNALQSGLKAGFSQEYSESITSLMPEWLSERLGDKSLLEKAEKVLNKTLEYEPVDEKGKIDTSLLSIQNKTATFVAERLNKAKYAARTEVTGKDGEPLIKNDIKELSDGELASLAYPSEAGASKEGVSA
jgi:wobble nucleotide-excising tRNase